MNIKPILKKESLITWKNIRLILIISAFNLFILIYYIFQLNIEYRNIINTMQVDYRVLLNLFKRILLFDYIIILLLSPAIASSGISAERQTNSFDLMMSTIISIPDIVLGKLLSHFLNIFIFLVSTLPIFMLVYIYGGLIFLDFIIIVFSYISSIYLLVCIGLFSSAVCSKTNASTILSYLIVVFIFFISPIIFSGFNNIFINIYSGFKINMFKCLLLFNPLITFLMALNRVSNTSIFKNDFFTLINEYVYTSNSDLYILSGIIFQIFLGSLLIFIALKRIKNIYKR